jgi:hypothetical protein
MQRLLEQRVSRLLDGLPPRHAPASLQARVLAELARRAALPWWRRSFGHWPVPVHAAFLLTCAALISLSLLGGVRLMSSLAAVSRHTLVGSAAGELIALGQATADLLGSMARLLPAGWLQVAALLAAVLYAMLFGLGAAAWRLLYRERQG